MSESSSKIDKETIKETKKSDSILGKRSNQARVTGHSAVPRSDSETSKKRLKIHSNSAKNKLPEKEVKKQVIATLKL